MDDTSPATDRTAVATLVNDEQFTIRGGVDDSGVMESIVTTAGFEPHLIAFAARTLPADGVAIDIGANIGVHTLSLSRIAAGGRVIAVEPAPQNLRHLEWNLATNGCDNVEPIAVGLSAEPGSAQLHFTASHPGGAYLATTEATEDVAVSVDLITLDELVDRAGIDRIDLIKLDVEGSEIEVLTGGQQALTRHRPVIVLEVNPIPLIRFRDASVSDLGRAAGRYGSLSLLQGDGSTTPVYGLAHLENLVRQLGIVDLVVGDTSVARRPSRELAWRVLGTVDRLAGGRLIPRLRPGVFVTEAAGTLSVAGPVGAVDADGRVTLTIDLTNHCDVALGPDGDHPARIGIRLPDGSEQRADLPVVPRGGSAQVSFDITVDPATLPVSVHVGVVQEGWAWLDDLHEPFGFDVAIPAPS